MSSCQMSYMGILKVVSVWCDRMNDCELIIWGFNRLSIKYVFFSILAFCQGLVNGLNLVKLVNTVFFHILYFN